MYEIAYLPMAKRDVEGIVLYISEHLKAPEAAIKLLDKLDHAIGQLHEFPYAHPVYRPIKPLDKEYRLLHVKNYNVFYTVCEQKSMVVIQRVVYAKMDLSGFMR